MYSLYQPYLLLLLSGGSLEHTFLSPSVSDPRPKSFFVYTTILSLPAKLSSNSGLCEVRGTR